MAIQGAVMTDDQFAQFQDAPKSWRKGVLINQFGGDTPLFALTNVMKTKTINSEEHYWFEEDMPAYRMKLAADTGTADPATFTVTVAAGDDPATNFHVNDILLVEQSGELVRVSSEPTSSTQITVQRSWGTTAATSVNPATSGVNFYLTKIGCVFPENSQAPSGRVILPTRPRNILQNFRHALQISERARNVEKRDEPWLQKALRQMRREHSVAIEMALFHGEYVDTTIGGDRATSMAGVISFISDGTGAYDNRKFTPASGTTFSYDELEEWLYNIFLKGSEQKMAFCGGRFQFGLIQALRQMKYAQINFDMTPGQKEYGMTVQRLVCPGGELIVKRHPLFTQRKSNTNTDAFVSMDAKAVILDMADITYCPLKNCDTKFQDNLQIPGTAGIKQGLYTDATIEVHHPDHHALISGVLGGKAES